ncbi:YbaB/EbfC family nucleoid-associated protein [Lactobacillus sp. ESL0791]|uniref:YbaB/EbfC family nucleoid-associated protein n=1 Tax=Lactobacillus sp. ESL0791 TaxID=2983234 RepID=UPI0023F73EB0|nr:YbaB/EbfC family nucleoid-associated protein [Lactobacillus sp. ESL0791]MDF7638389.1 YbaB/EbfC family nucleoid-associated protein [Lactobacillus sp. ESL0791]
MSKRPNFGGMGGMNMQQMMKQAKKLQEQMTQEQESITAQEFTGKSADDLVVAIFTGDRKLKDLKINPEAIDPDDPDMLQDLVIDAVNKGLEEIDQATQASLGKYTKGMI